MQATTVTVIILSYLLLLFQYSAAAKNGSRDVAAALCEKFSLQLLNKRTIHTIPFMILSIVLYSLSGHNIFQDTKWNGKFILVTILLSCLCAGISIVGGFQSGHKMVRTISIQESIGYFSLRIPGLIIYEIFFRAVLLGIFTEWFSITAAIAFNIILYALAHAFSSRKEFIGSIFFGLLLCCITIVSRSIFPAVLLHLCLALPYETILLTKSQLLTKKIRL